MVEDTRVFIENINDEEFKEFKFTLDNVMKEQVANGVGSKISKTEILMFTDEVLLWSLGLIGYHNPEVLMNTVLFPLGLNCTLRAGKEHYILQIVPFDS